MTDETGHFSKYTQFPFCIQENEASVLSILNVFRRDMVKDVEQSHSICTHRDQSRLQGRGTLHSINVSPLYEVWSNG